MASTNPDHWQCERTLCECMEYMLDNQINCDVTFIVGAEREEVHAHKFVLISRSPVFHAMFEGPLAEKGKVELPDVEKDVFMVFLRCLYTDDCGINFQNVMDLLYIAKKYCVDLLAKSCLRFLKLSISPDTVCQIMVAAHAISELEVYGQCLLFIKSKFTESIKSRDFATLSMKCLEDIMAIENFVIMENELFENLMRWAESECRRQNLDVSWENKRRVLGDILYKVRFPVMEPEYFAWEVATTDLLSDAEKATVLLYHSTQKGIIPKYFRVDERVRKVMRCGQTSTRRSVNPNDKDFVLIFTVSHDSWLHGILVYGCNSGSCRYVLTLQVNAVDDESGNKTVEKTRINTTSDTKVYNIMLESKLVLKAREYYRIHLHMRGYNRNLKTYRGENEMECVTYGPGKYATFSHNNGGEETCHGQIPGLLLT